MKLTQGEKMCGSFMQDNAMTL